MIVIKILKKSDFIWKEKIVNGTDGKIDYWYTVYYNGNSSRKYYVVPQYPLNEKGCVDISLEPELYIYFEAIGEKVEDEKLLSSYGIGDGYKYNEGVFKRAFKSLDEAKEWAYKDYYNIYGYAMSFLIH